MRLKFILLIACLTLVSCSAQTSTGAMTSEADNSVLEQEELPLMPSENMDAPLDMAISSPFVRVVGDLAIELSQPRLEKDPVKGWFFDFGFCYTGLSLADLPEPGESDLNPTLIVNLQFFRSEEELPLEMEVIGAGRSRATVEGVPQICENQFYQFPSDVVAGQAEHIIAFVTFHEIFGIAEPMRYEMDVFPLPLQGPQK